MANMAISRGMTGSGVRIIASIFGLLLLISIFLPWMSPTARLGSRFSSASGMNVSALLGLAAILGGLLVIGLAWAPLRGARGGLHIVLGLAALAVFGVMLFNHTLPLLSSLVRSLISIGAGVYLYAFSALAVTIIGITELPKRRPKVRNRVAQTPEPYPAQAYGAPMQPYPGADPPAAFCRNCGTQLNFGAAFCAGCGAPTAVAMSPFPAYSPPVYQQMPVRPVQRVSGAWWLLPIFLGALGGIIAFLAVIKRRPGMAVAMLVLGIILTVILYLIIRNIANSLSGLGI